MPTVIATPSTMTEIALAPEASRYLSAAFGTTWHRFCDGCNGSNIGDVIKHLAIPVLFLS
jgi:hypothetical protein